MEVYRVVDYASSAGKYPYRDWLSKLDEKIRARIQLRILRFRMGNLGDYKILGGGLFEARFSFGSGYRVYFGKVENKILLLLLGGDKRSQTRDIMKARLYWDHYLNNRKEYLCQEEAEIGK